MQTFEIFYCCLL